MRSSSNAKRCVFENCEETQELYSVPKKIRYQIIQQHRIFIPKRARTCLLHSRCEEWNTATTNFRYTIDLIEDLIELLINKNNAIDYNGDVHNSENKNSSIGLNDEQFQQLFSMLPTLHRTYIGRQKTAVAALRGFLMRLRTGDTYDKIASSLGVSRLSLKRMLTSARTALLEDVVAQYFGLQNIDRNILLENNTTLAQKIFCDGDNQKAITIWDGTYIYCNKSFNQYLQRLTYSGQKMRNLLKPMVCVTPNGYYVDIFGPYSATKNDASIMAHVLESNPELFLNKLRCGDIFLLDRGFRDCVDILESKGYIVKMPEFVQKNDNTGQLTTQKANRSRLVTANRFSIESRNGNIKMIWKVFDSRWNAYDQAHMFDDYRIAATLINLFYKKIIPNKHDAEDIASKMLERVDDINALSRIVNTNQFQRQIKNFESGQENTVIFPILTFDELKFISLGNYQIKQMNGYIIEHMRVNEGQFPFYVCPNAILSSFFGELVLQNTVAEPLLILAELKSRFKNRSKYRTFVFADKSKNGADGIIAHCCECRHGLRTVGCCSHIMSLIGYLGYIKHNQNELKETSQFLVNKIIK